MWFNYRFKPSGNTVSATLPIMILSFVRFGHFDEFMAQTLFYRKTTLNI